MKALLLHDDGACDTVVATMWHDVAWGGGRDGVGDDEERGIWKERLQANDKTAILNHRYQV